VAAVVAGEARPAYTAIRQGIQEVTIPDPPHDETFDSAFLSELEGLVADSGVAVSSAAQGAAGARGYRETLAAFLAPVSAGEPPLNERVFLELPASALAQRCNGLIESGRASPRHEAAQAVESFVVFFQALVPTLAPESSREVKATFFRLVPTLVQMAWEDLGDEIDRRRDSRASLGLLETILLEVSSVRLAPVESGMLFKSLDQLATLIAAGEYTLARDVVAVPLLGILRKNRVARSLFRLMEVEVALQVYIKERLGHATPRIRIPDDVPALSDFGPLRVFDEEGPDGVRRTYLQVQLPDIPILSDIVVHLSPQDGGLDRRLRLDGLGSVPFDVPPGLYEIGLLFEPDPSRGA
jgi:hypothetical protein